MSDGLLVGQGASEARSLFPDKPLYAPVRKSAMAFVDDSVREFLPTATENVGNVIGMGYKWWTTNKKAIEIEARFTRWRLEKPWRYDFDRPPG